MREAAASVIEKKEYDLKNGITIMNAQIESKRKILESLVKEIEVQTEIRKSLTAIVNKEKVEKLKAIDDLYLIVKEKGARAQSAMEAAIMEKNFLEQEKSTVIGKRQELHNLIGQYEERIGKIKRLVE